jgi:hypothetical protein
MRSGRDTELFFHGFFSNTRMNSDVSRGNQRGDEQAVLLSRDDSFKLLTVESTEFFGEYP